MDEITARYDDELVVCCLVACSLLLRVTLSAIGQSWISTFAHTATIFVLPIITYIITSVISGNIALSLGLVGALSIVRFRNPVKSPFELAVYFFVITLGIAASVQIKWVLLLEFSVILIIVGLVLANFFYNKIFGYFLFSSSFSEGNEMSILELDCKEKIEGMLENPFLLSFIVEGKGFRYVLASRNRKAILSQAALLEGDKRVISSHLKL